MESDQKPLETMLCKPLALVSPRLLCTRYSINLIHRPGKEIPVADTLWRKWMDDEDHSLAEAMETQVYSVIRLGEIKTTTPADEQLSTSSRSFGQAGWRPTYQ